MRLGSTVKPMFVNQGRGCQGVSVWFEAVPLGSIGDSVVFRC